MKSTNERFDGGINGVGNPTDEIDLFSENIMNGFSKLEPVGWKCNYCNAITHKPETHRLICVKTQLAEKDIEINSLKNKVKELLDIMKNHRDVSYCLIDPIECETEEYEFIDDCGSVCSECHNLDICMTLKHEGCY